MSAYTGVIVRMSDFRHCKFCARGVREAFARYDADYEDFLINGIEADVLLTISNNDAMALQVVEVAYGRQQ